ncbi:MAG: glycerol kinase GlpK [Planctomycetes bacterium]|nr:glycerol kinase GlpK [Planctomycetota bacterium]
MILAIDQGTTGTRAVIVDRRGRFIASAYREHAQHFPHPGWVEHDALEIRDSVRRTIRQAMAMAGIRPAALAAVGITNQRETVVAWDRNTGRPVAPAIVWQCRRTVERCADLSRDGWGPVLRRRTGLTIDAYFSATKMEWILRHVPAARSLARGDRLAFGTIDSWVLWNLTGGRVHATDFTNASRTMLFDIHRRRWDPRLLRAFGVPRSALPEVRPSSGTFGSWGGVPIAGIAGDQQAALFGQLGASPGSLKNTYGTGCFLLLNTGARAIASRGGLLTTLACGPRGEPVYALEGSVFIGGAAVQWLRDALRLIGKSRDSESLSRAAPPHHGVVVVPAFVGLGAPYWRGEARGAIFGLTRGSDRAVFARATLESIAHQVTDVLEAMRRDARIPIRELRVDGGACANNFLMQLQADLAGVKVERPANVESTVLGAAFLAGLGSGFWRSLGDLAHLRRTERRFDPSMGRREREDRRVRWRAAVAAVLHFADRTGKVYGAN